MTRLGTSGFEFAEDSVELLDTPYGATGFSYDTGIKRSGSRSGKFHSGTVDTPTRRFNWTGVSGRNYYSRIYLYVPTSAGWPTTTMDVASVDVATVAVLCAVQLTTTGTLQGRNAGASNFGSTPALSFDTWYRIEIRVKIGVGATDEIEWLLDGVQQGVATGQSISDTPPNCLRFGWLGSPGTNKIMYMDDYAANDDQGSNANTWPGEGKVVLLLPISDNNRGTWTGGTGGTTNLWDAIDNIPPAGTATETNTSQIENAQNTASAPGDFNMTTYTSAGLSAGTAKVIEMHVVHGEDSPTGTKTGSFTIVSNPALGSTPTFTFGNDQASALGTYPSFWVRTKSALLYDQTPTVGTSPVARVTKTTSSTAVGSVCFVGILVDWQATVAAAGTRRIMVIS